MPGRLLYKLQPYYTRIIQQQQHLAGAHLPYICRRHLEGLFVMFERLKYYYSVSRKFLGKPLFVVSEGIRGDEDLIPEKKIKVRGLQSLPLVPAHHTDDRPRSASPSPLSPRTRPCVFTGKEMRFITRKPVIGGII